MGTDSKARFGFTELVIAIVAVVVTLIWAGRLAWRQIITLLAENHAVLEKVAVRHRAEARAFQEKADASLNRLQRFLFAALLCLLVSGATIMLRAHRRMITPLRTTLTESRAIIERQQRLASRG